MGPEWFGQLVERHAAALVLYARQWCAAPEDVVQEALLKLAGRQPPPDRPVPWLYRVVRNAAIDAGRADARRRRHETACAENIPAWFLESESEAGIDGEQAADALRRLPAEQREAIIAHLWSGLTFEQIAELMGSSSSTVNRWYLAGLATLRERLGGACPTKPTLPD